ncbi:TonB-dependent receptor plug domain-containing protein [Vibrio alfacsensis]|uniref:TonB-dependent receptor plug domain-containing protein n=1 Tax=Vibrio alfacsensis TaxID=1074311 RepID=UPI004067DEE2
MSQNDYIGKTLKPWPILVDHYSERYYRDMTTSDWISGELRLNSEAIEGQRWITGVEWRRDMPLDSQYQYFPDETGTFEADRSNIAAYIQGEFSLGDDWLLIAGGRLDNYDYYDTEFSPRLSLIWTPTASSTVKLVHSEAFRTPSAIEFNYGQFPNYSGEMLKPEQMQSQELVYEYRRGGVFITATAYYNKLKNSIVEDYDAFYINDHDVTSKGIELSAQYRHVSGLGGYANYSYQDTSRKDDAPVMNSPEHLGKAGIDGQFFDERLTTALEWQYTSDREVDPGYPIANAYHLVNLHMTLRPWQQGPELSLKALNLMDEDYGMSAYLYEFPGRGREVWFGITQTL